MDVMIIAIIVAVALLVFGVIASYNRFHKQRNVIQESWRQIDVELRRRYDLIPNLVETAKAYAVHERSVLEAVTAARAQAAAPSRSIADQAQDENQLTLAVRQLFAVAENYPQLTANENVRMLQEELTATENKVGFARQFYNDIATKYNIAREVFPANMVAGMFGFGAAELFQVTDDAERQVPAVDLSMKK